MVAYASGMRLIPARINGRDVVAITTRTSSSSTFTSETVIDSVTAPLVDGRTYRVRWTVQWDSTVANDGVFARIRAGSTVAGAQLQSGHTRVHTTGGTGVRYDGTIEAYYTASATGNQTFVGTGERASGTGNIMAEAGSTFPIVLSVEYAYEA